MHQSKENFGPVIPSILPAHWPGRRSIVRPHMECAAQSGTYTWEKIRILLESIQKFAYKITINKGYDELLYMTNLPSVINTVEFLSIYSKDYLLLATVAWVQYIQLTARSKARFTAQFKGPSSICSPSVRFVARFTARSQFWSLIRTPVAWFVDQFIARSVALFIAWFVGRFVGRL